MNPARAIGLSGAGRLVNRPRLILAGLMSVVSAWYGPARAESGFGHLAVRIERNVTDQDFEVVFEATGHEAGLLALKATAPDGRTVIDFKAPDTRLGIRHFKLESPEPKTLDGLRRDYPEGAYRFSASTTAGDTLNGQATLSHALPGAAAVLQPRPDDEAVRIRGLRIRWAAGSDRASCIVSIENEATGATVLQATLPGSATSLPVPDQLLGAGTRYKLAIGAVAAGGNASFVEASFATARQP